jgi:L-asparaginase II
MTVAPVLVEMTRAGLIESVHRGHAVLLDSNGKIEKTWGNPQNPFYPRSAIKLAQATAMLQSSAKLENEKLAISCASHSGEDIHIELVTKMLEDIGLTPESLQCPPDLPLDSATQISYIARGLKPARVAMNCSGKHAGMLSACVASSWPTSNYLSMDHPLQKEIIKTIEELGNEKIFKSTQDGCGAPLHAISLIALARIAQSSVLADIQTSQRKVVDAARKFPIYNSGHNRDVAEFMQNVPGFFTKEGAEGVHVGALPDGRSFAVKFEDGSMRPRASFVVAVLKYWGISQDILEKLSNLEKIDVLGGGKPVGSIKALPIERN